MIKFNMLPCLRKLATKFTYKHIFEYLLMFIDCSQANVSIQFSLSVVSDSLQPHELQYARPPCLSPTPSPPKPMSIVSVMPSNYLIICHPLLILSSIFPASGSFQISQLSAWGGQNIGVQLQHQFFQWTPRTDLLRMDWLDLAVQGTLQSLQHHTSKASILWHSAFFTVQSRIHMWLLEKP